jgi:hypothetical protein
VDSEVQLHLAAAAQHEFDIITNLFWAFTAILATNSRFITHAILRFYD